MGKWHGLRLRCMLWESAELIVAHKPRPTEEGLRRYPATDGYYRKDERDADKCPCQCTPRCPNPCAGRCGCVACAIALIDRQIDRLSKSLL